MARKKDEALITLGVIVGLPLVAVRWMSEKTGIPESVILVAVAVAIVAGSVGVLLEQRKKFHAIRLANIDEMSGIQFEHYLKKLFSHRGYRVSITKASGDLGVDLIAVRGDERIAIQVKRYQRTVSRRAVSDAVAGMKHYRCNRAMVVTNSYFTPGAQTLARANNCPLVDRDKLGNWIVEMQKSQRLKPPSRREPA
jgi:restriction system protein